MKVYGLIALLSLGFISKSWAMEYGIGVSLKSHDNFIYLPLKLTSSLLLEPYYRQNEYESFYGSGSSGNEQEEVGLGFFGRVTDDNDMSFYYGVRAGYVERVNEYQYTNNISIEKNYGYRFSPTIGFEYSLFESLSLSGEAEWFKYKLDGSSKDNVSQESTGSTTKGTDTRIIIRYFFN